MICLVACIDYTPTSFALAPHSSGCSRADSKQHKPQDEFVLNPVPVTVMTWCCAVPLLLKEHQNVHASGRLSPCFGSKVGLDPQKVSQFVWRS